MKKVAVIGATSQIASWAVEALDKDDAIELTLFAKNLEKLPENLKTTQRFQGDAEDADDIRQAVKGQDIIYASLAGDVVRMAKTLTQVMAEEGVKRLIWTSSLGIHNEIPGEFGRWNQQVMRDYFARYADAADIVMKSDLDFTVVRPAWLTDLDEVEYETTDKDEPFKGTEVSRKSTAYYVLDLIEHPEKDSKKSIGVNKPATEADRPRPSVMAANSGYEPETREEIELRFP